uniref:Legume lectin domain-containing protein n=2 Tax=Oryza punctata TaxID=4537 RepID=A0A0E0M6G4_ORYPU
MSQVGSAPALWIGLGSRASLEINIEFRHMDDSYLMKFPGKVFLTLEANCFKSHISADTG